MQNVRLEFLSVDIETSADCTSDYVALYDGPDSSAPAILNQPLCGAHTSVTVTSTQNEVYMEFNTDLQNQFNGFAVDVEFCE